MKVNIDGLLVYFPYEFIYPEQFYYMLELKKSLDAKGHALLEMPSGTGKTSSLLSLIVAYMKAFPNLLEKFVYCSRTVPELEKIAGEMKILDKYYASQACKQGCGLLTVVLSSRKHLCIERDVRKAGNNANIDAACRRLTASFIRRKRLDNSNIPGCRLYEEFDSRGRIEALPTGIYNLSDLKVYGKTKGYCPYFLSRNAMKSARIIIYSYFYILDPKISTLVQVDLPKHSVVVFDEAHNIDNVCIESMSCIISQRSLENCVKSISSLSDNIQSLRKLNSSKLNEEYNRLLKNLHEFPVNNQPETDVIGTYPILTDDLVQFVFPGSLRSAESFLSFLRRFLEYLKLRLRISHVVQETPVAFLRDCLDKVCIDQRALKFCADRLKSLISTLEIIDIYEYRSLILLCDFATLISTYSKGFSLIIEPYEALSNAVFNPTLYFQCVDASIAMKPILERVSSVILTSGTLSPLEIYPKMLDFTPVNLVSLTMSLTRNCICPMIVSKGNDQVDMTTKFTSREDIAVIRNYGNLLAEMCLLIPDGIVAFFPSYGFLESTFAGWYDQHIIEEIQKHKLIFVETNDSEETSMALINYQRACENGRGAVLLSVARGKISEGIDFTNHLGRCVILFGVPFVYTQSRILKARMNFLREKYNLRPSEFIIFDAMRNAAQCLGRVIRGKSDYGIMVLADKRYARVGNRTKLPAWIQNQLSDEMVNISVEDSIQLARQFLKVMGQPFCKTDQIGIALLTVDQVEELINERLKVQLMIKPLKYSLQN